MNKKPRFLQLSVVMISAIMLLVSFWALYPEHMDSHHKDAEIVENIAPDVPKATGTRASPRTVLAELFTNWGCPPCAYANPAINELCDVYGPSQLVMIAYHTDWPALDDPYNLFNPLEVQTRVTYYSVSGVPSIF